MGNKIRVAKNVLVWAYLVGLAASSFGSARAAAPIGVRVAVGKVTEVEFPEKVAKVVKGGAADSVLVEVLENSVYLLPKAGHPQDIFVAGISGESYPLNLVIAPEHDVRLQVNGSDVRRVAQENKMPALDLMKHMLRGEEPPGATVVKSGQKTAYKNDQINLSLEVMYEFPNLAGYVLTARNLTDNSVVIPLEQMSFPGLLAATLDQDILKPKGQRGDSAKVYLVVGK